MSEQQIAHLRKDPVLAVVIDRVGEYGLKIRPNRYRALVEAIVTQQLSGSAADAVLGRMLRIYGGRFPRPARIAATPDSVLREAGLSRMKVEYIKDVSERIESGKLRLGALAGMPDERVIEELVRIRGIGVWTAHMFLIFSLGRRDVLPVGDLGIRRAFKVLYGVTGEEEMTRIAEVWRPYRTVATWYLWKGQRGFEGI